MATARFSTKEGAKAALKQLARRDSLQQAGAKNPINLMEFEQTLQSILKSRPLNKDIASTITKLDQNQTQIALKHLQQSQSNTRLAGPTTLIYANKKNATSVSRRGRPIARNQNADL